jgi:4-amino-4-deoxy-L-arabinose transferase-like glycosyltransferase|tara:strand:+ start:56433 stop:58142 length:1710 start_codon:yes stop_codon:yes gene_type:complete
MKIWLREHIALVTTLITYLVLFLPFVGQVHLFDWDEINFAEAAREMVVSGDWINVQINFEPFWEKPPLFIWLQAICMKVFGVNEFAARFPNVVIGFITLLALYFPVLKQYGKRAAIFTLLLYLGSFTPHFYFKSGIIDPLFNLFMYVSVLYLVYASQKRTHKNFLLAGLFLGLAVLTKGPAALLLIGLTGLCFQLIYKVHFYRFSNIIVLVTGILITPTLYFGIQVYENGWWFLQEFLVYQVDLFKNPVASHGQPFYYHFVVLLIGCFPLFILSFGSMLSKRPVGGDITFYRWMKVLFWVVLVVFSLVTTKIVHYSSMCYIPLAIVGGVKLTEYIVLSRFTKIALAAVGGLWVIVLTVAGSFALPLTNGPLALLKKLVQDEFVQAQLATDTVWTIVPIVLAVLLAVSLVRFLGKPTLSALASLLVTNTLVVAFLMISFIPRVEQVVQGKWIQELEHYQGKEIAHFTRGFKSYAHRYYTHQQDFESFRIAKAHVLKQLGNQSLYKMDEDDRKIFANAVREYVIDSTAIPVSLSAKLSKFEEVDNRYPNLTRVFEGNGYGVWERTSAAHIE